MGRGRPKKLPNESAIFVVRARLYFKEMKMLEEICAKTGTTKSEIIRSSIRDFYEKMQK